MGIFTQPDPHGARRFHRYAAIGIAGTVLWLLSRSSFLPFHTAIELFAVGVAALIALEGWRAFRDKGHGLLAAIGMLYLIIGGIDLAHTVAYHGMELVAGLGPNPPTQLWILSRLLEASGLALLLWFANSQRVVRTFLWLLPLLAIIGLSSIYPLKWFPDVFLPESGLTPLKIYAEYLVIGLILLAAIGLKKHAFLLSAEAGRRFQYALILTALAELCFTPYVSGLWRG